MAVAVHCPKCKAPIALDGQSAGSVLICGGCGQRLKVPASAAGRSGGGSSPGAAAAAVDTGKPADVTRNDRRSNNEPTQAQRIGRFEIKERLGAGQFGTVYRAFDTVLKRDVALKVPQASLVDDDAAKKRFLREAEAAAQLRHPHIVPVYDAGREGDTFYIASAFIEGATLEKAVEANRPDFRQAADWVRKLAGALAYAGGQGIVHRDVKPANIMLDQAGEPHLMDFGLARTAEAADKLTHDGSLMGTPAYMSPEQAGADVGPVSPASDQYSLGVVLYELLCGQRPFPEGNVLQVIYQIREKTPDSPRTINPAIPRDLETICQKAMARQPGDRYTDCAALAEDMRRWLADEPITARRLGLPERAVRWTRRNPAVAGLGALAVALLMVLGVGGAFAAWRQASLRDIADQRTVDAIKERDAKDKLVVQLERSLVETQEARDAAEQKERDRAAEEQRRIEEEGRRKEAEDQKEESIQEKEQAEVREDLARKHLAYVEALQPFLEQLESSDQFIGPPPALRGNEPFMGWENGFLGTATRPPIQTSWVSIPSAATDQGTDVRDGASLAFPLGGSPTPSAWSGDGRYFVFVAGDGGLWALQAASGNLRPLPQQGTRIVALQSAPDGTRVAGACGDGKLRLWSLIDGTVDSLEAPPAAERKRKGRSSSGPIGATPASAPPLTGVAWDPAGSRLVATRADGGLVLFELSSTPSSTVLLQHDEPLTCVAWQPSGALLAFGDMSGKVHLWDGSNLKRRRTLPFSSSPVVQVAWSGDGEMLLMANHQAQSVLRIADDQRPESTNSLGPRPIVWDTQGARLLMPWGQSDFGSFRLLYVGTGQVRDLAAQPTGERPLEPATSLAVSSDGVVAAVYARMVLLTSLRRRIAVVSQGHAAAVAEMTWISDKALATGAIDGGVNVLTPLRNDLRRLSSGGPPVLGLAGDAAQVYALHEQGFVEWTMADGARRDIALRRMPKSARHLAIGGSPRWLAIGGEEILVVSTEGKPIHPEPSNRGVADTTLALTTTAAGHLFALSLGRESTPGLFARSWPGPLPFPGGGAYPDFCELLSGAGSGAFAPTCAEADLSLQRFVLGFPDGRLFFLSRTPMPQPLDGRRTAPPPFNSAHAGGVKSAAWFPDERGSRLATGGANGSVIVWDTSEGDKARELLRLRTSANAVTRVGWSPDGRYLAAGGDDGSVTIWDGGPQK